MEISGKSKVIGYWSLCILCASGYLILRGNSWQSNAQLHTILETISTILALMVGVLAILRFYSKAGKLFLFIGAGFLGTAVLDGFHAIVTSDYLGSRMPSDLPALIPWSWLASRQLLALVLAFAWFNALQEKQRGGSDTISASGTYFLVAIFTISSFLFFIFAPLPRAYYPELLFHRPEEFVPGFFFFVALLGLLNKGGWRHDPFEHWLIVSLIIGLLGQVVFMPLSGQLFDFEFDMAHLMKIGSYLSVLVGLIISMYAIFQESRGNEIRIKAILDTVNDAIITIDDQGIVQSFNPMAERTFGYSAESVIGQNIKMIMAVSFSIHHDQYIRDYLTTGQAKIIGQGREVIGLRKDGIEIPIELTITETRVDGRPVFVGSCRDISERKETERQIRDRTSDLELVNTELKAFAYSVSHDLRAPLRAMDGFSEALLEDYGDILDDNAKNYLGRISQAGRRMGVMIDDILTLSRATSRERQIEEVDLSALAREITSELRRNSKDRDVSIIIAPNLQVLADTRSLRIILGNLIENAWKFTQNKTSARIEFGGYEDGGETIYFVRDDGVGFDMAYGGKLFDIFQRLHSVSEFDGTGVGLAIVARLVHHHGGRVWGEGKVNEGATFFFTINEQVRGRQWQS